MHMPLNYTSINLCKYTASGCLEKALKSEKVSVDKLQRKTPLYGWVQIIFFRLMIYISVTVGAGAN
jgi:hypothetical protein